MRHSLNGESQPSAQSHGWWSGVGVASFMLFLLKGLLWLLAPVLLTVWR